VSETRALLAAALLGALAALTGCSGEGDAGLHEQVEKREGENKTLKEQVARLSKELRALQKQVDDLDLEQQRLGKTLVKAEKSLESQLKEMVQKEIQGRRRPYIPQRPAVRVRFVERPYMGFDGQTVQPDLAEHLKLKAKAGVLVTEVREDSPAALAGLKRHDVVQGFDGEEIKTFQDLERALAKKKPGQVVTIAVLRGEKKAELKVKLTMRKRRVEGGAMVPKVPNR